MNTAAEAWQSYYVFSQGLIAESSWQIFGYFIFHVILYFDIGCLPSVSFFDLTYRGVTK